MNNTTNQIRLTRTELLVLQLIAYEYSSKEIAKLLYVSEQTIYTHRANILLKLDAKNSAGLVRKAIEFNLLKPKSIILSDPRLNTAMAIV